MTKKLEKSAEKTVFLQLHEIVTQILENQELPETAIIELEGFDATAATMEEYMQKREETRKLVTDSEFFDQKTELNLSVVRGNHSKLWKISLLSRFWPIFLTFHPKNLFLNGF